MDDLRKNVSLLGVMILLVSLVLWGCGGNNVVASVNGEKITTQELDQNVEAMKAGLEQQGLIFEGDQGKEFEQMLRRDVLNQMIDQKLILQEAEKRGLLPTDKEVAGEIEQLKKQLGSEGEFKKFLAANGVNEPKLNDLVKQQLALNKLQEQIASGVSRPSGEEIKNYYEQNKDQFSTPEQRQVRHILIGVGDYSNGKNRTEMEAKVLALQVAEKLRSGADFAELAKQYSDDPGSKDNGGEYPPFSRGSGFVKEFEDAAFNLKEGEFTAEPVKTAFGYHIIRLDKVIPAKVQSLAEVKDDIAERIRQEAVSKKMDDFMQELRDKAKIVNNLGKDPSGQAEKGVSTKK
jgi:peptidyl-prolyl cis-trans isomerase C